MSSRIIDVRLNNKSANGEANIRDEVVRGLSQSVNRKTLPTLLLYDEEGPEYYLFAAEENILKNHASDIVNVMRGSHNTEGHRSESVESIILELGAGALRKTSRILSALTKIVPEQMSSAPVTYYALDLEKRELERSLDQLAASSVGPEMQGKIDARALWGTYESGLKFVEEGGLRGREAADAAVAAIRARSLSSDSSVTQPSSPSSSEQDLVETPLSTPDLATLETPLHILFLGSSLGNFTRGEDLAFLRSLPLRVGKGDTLLLGLDHGTDGARIESAYNDRAGITRRFILNGLKGAGRALGNESLFAPENWEYVGRYNVQERRHEAFYRSRVAQTVRVPETKLEFAFLADELVNIEMSHKYTERETYHLFTEANLRPLRCWRDGDSGYSLW
ncbi:histidine-specific methyltransferase, partial [Multifurca ochricompacta]